MLSLDSPISKDIFSPDTIISPADAMCKYISTMEKDNDSLPPFSKWLKRQLLRRGWSGPDLAREMELSPGTTWNWLNGKRKLSDPVLIRRMADALNVHQDEILEQLNIRESGADRMSPAVRRLAPVIDAYNFSDEQLDTIEGVIRAMAGNVHVPRIEE